MALLPGVVVCSEGFDDFFLCEFIRYDPGGQTDFKKSRFLHTKSDSGASLLELTEYIFQTQLSHPVLSDKIPPPV